jgi:membrane associated rhomboid family serine protease
VFYSPDGYIPSLGASGAIAGVLGAYAIKFPKNKVRVLMMRMVTQMPAFIVLGLWILLQVFSQVGTPAGEASGVAYMAHIGGFVAGVVLIILMARRRDRATGGLG